MATAKKKTKVIEGEVTETPETPQNAPEATIVASPSPIDIVRPMISPEQARANWKAYQDLCKAILEPEDFYKMTQFVKGKGSVTKALKLKTAWRKLATAFNLSSEIYSEKRIEYEKFFVVQMVVRTTAPNGRHVDGTGTCASNERTFQHLEHDVRAMAETRAKNRSIADMIGGGEVSAEEMMQMEEQKREECPRDHEKLAPKTSQTEGKNKGRPYTRCTLCYWGKWMDTGELWNAGKKKEEEAPVEE